MTGKTVHSTPPRNFRVDGGGIAVSNPNGEHPIRVSWHELIMAVDAVQATAEKLGPEFTSDLDRAYVVLSAMALRHGFDPAAPTPTVG